MNPGLPRRDALLIAPALLLAAVVLGLPMLRVLQLSVSDAGPAGDVAASRIGFHSYARLWQDGRWWMSLRNTAVFTACSVPLEFILGVGTALLLHRAFPGRGIVRTITVLPWALPTAVMALAWAWIFNDAFGVANDLLLRLRLIERPVAWLGEPAPAMAAMIIADAWKTTPFVTLVALAGLQGIPHEVLEAATLDGLGAWRRFSRVVLPLVMPALLVALVYRLVQAWAAFDLAYVMTGGGPGGTTETISLYSLQNYFRYLDFGYGSAIAVQGMILVALLTWLLMRISAGRAEQRS